MFQFTTTNVFNSNYDLTTGKPLWSEQDATDEKGASLNIKRVGNFNADYVTHIYKSVAIEPENAEATVDLSLLNAEDGDKFCLSMYIRLTEGSNYSLYANDSYYKGKPFVIEFVWKGDDPVKNAHNIVKTIDKFLLNIHGEKIVDVKHKGGSLVIRGINEFQRFAKLDISKLDEKAYHGMGKYDVVLSSENEDEIEFKQGVEGFGTYTWILNNLRLPTPMRTRWEAINKEENPIPGALYNQYTIHYCVNRGTLGNNAVGDQVTSHTTHVFYVNQDISDDFETALSKIGKIEEVKLKGKTNSDEDKDDLENLEEEK